MISWTFFPVRVENRLKTHTEKDNLCFYDWGTPFTKWPVRTTEPEPAKPSVTSTVGFRLTKAVSRQRLYNEARSPWARQKESPFSKRKAFLKPPVYLQMTSDRLSNGSRVLNIARPCEVRAALQPISCCKTHSTQRFRCEVPTATLTPSHDVLSPTEWIIPQSSKFLPARWTPKNRTHRNHDMQFQRIAET